MRKLLLILALLGIMTSSIAALAVSAEEAETANTVTTTYTFGGANGQWETDADNSTGIWSYYHSFGTIATIQSTAMTLNEAQDQYSNGEAYFSIRKDGFMHPGASGNFSNPIVGLKVEKSGTMVMSMSATKPEEGGNGTVAKFLVNNDEGLLVEKTVATIAETTMTATAQVTAGDMVYFLIHHAFDIACDGATYVVTYTLTSEVGTEPETPVEPSNTTTYTFGGANGQWETDADNSTGVWSYYHSFGTISTIQSSAMTLNDAQDQYSNGEAYFAIRKDGFMHPGASGNFSMPVVGLKIEKNGTLSGVMTATRGADAETTEFGVGNNGTMAKFLLNANETPITEVHVCKTTNTMSFENVKVNAGDMVYFLIHHINAIADDGATYVVTYTLTEETNNEPDTPVVPDEPDTPVIPEEPIAPVTPISGCNCGETCDHTADTCYCASSCECANCANFQNKVEGDVEDVNNIDDFRFVQGAKGFTYLYGKVSEGIEGLAELSVANTNWDTAGVLPYLAIRMDGLMHPGMTDTAYMVALAWTAEKASTVDVYFDAIFESVVGNNGDGVTVGIYLNNTCLNSFALNPAGFNEESNPYAIEFNSIKVNEGDVLYFTVSPNETLNFDGVLTYVEISWAKEADIPADSGNTSTNESASENTNEPATSSCGGSMGVSTAIIGAFALAVAGFSKKRKEN